MEKNRKSLLAVLLIGAVLSTLLAGCSSGGVKLDPKNPVTLTVWHYYNGAISNAFDAMLDDFNATVGREKGIVVEANGMGSISELESAVKASADKEVGSLELPAILATYADTAFFLEQKGLLAKLDDYLTAEEQALYVDGFLDEGRIGLGGELRILPVAKSTEIFMLNRTDWEPFAKAEGLDYDDLSTVEGLTEVAGKYYHWTDAQTPAVPNDGKAFYGRDSMANMMIIGSVELGAELFHVENGQVTLNVDRAAMKKLWDNYYVPYISGYFGAYGRYRSDDAKVGALLCYTGSTSSAAYFPREVTTDSHTYPIDVTVLPVPHFADASPYHVQQGAGMAVTKSTPEREYASSEFLKWFTAPENNILFSAMSAYIPVQKAAADYDVIKAQLEGTEITMSPVADETLRTALSEMSKGTLYSGKAFAGGVGARSILENHLATRAAEDRQAVEALLAAGTEHAQAVAQYDTDAQFEAWVTDLSDALTGAIE